MVHVWCTAVFIFSLYRAIRKTPLTLFLLVDAQYAMYTLLYKYKIHILYTYLCTDMKKTLQIGKT